MTTITQQSATTHQIKQINRLGSDAIEKVLSELGLDKSSAQRIIEHGDEFTSTIREVAIVLLKDLSVTNKYKSEEVQSEYGYFSGYTEPKSIVEQCNILRQTFPSIGFAKEGLEQRKVPKHAEGWFAIPKWQTLASSYAEAVQKVFDAIKRTRRGEFHNYHEGQIVNERLRQTAETQAVFQKLGEEQRDYDILVIAAQLGIRHRGRSVRRACEVMQANEYGLGAFALGIMILTHPKRLLHHNDLWIYCPGDEYNAQRNEGDGSGNTELTPYFEFARHFSLNDGIEFDGIEFDAHSGSDVFNNIGSASAFLP